MLDFKSYCLGYGQGNKCDRCQLQDNWNAIGDLMDEIRLPMQRNMQRVDADLCVLNGRPRFITSKRVMMTTKLKGVLDHLELIAQTSKKQEKAYLLAQMGPLGQQVLRYALDPYLMFGVKNFNRDLHHLGVNGYEDPDQLFSTLDALAERRVTGAKARTECEFIVEKYWVPAELLWRILNKDLRCGVSADTVNKIFPKLIPEFKVALADKYEGFDGPKMVSIKYDGLRCLAFCQNGEVELKTRNGLLIESAPEVNEAIKAYPFAEGRVLDGEIMIEGEHFQDSSGKIRSKSKGSTEGKAVFYIFDWLPIDEFHDKRGMLNQMERSQALVDNPPPVGALKGVTHYYLDNEDDIQKAYEGARSLGHEGLIAKDPMATYQFRRSSAWQKLKDQISVDVKVTGIYEGTKGTKYEGMLGGIIVDFDGLPNQVGSGISDEQRDAWFKNPDLILEKTVEVLYHEKTKAGNMRHSRLKCVRVDK